MSPGDSSTRQAFRRASRSMLPLREPLRCRPNRYAASAIRHSGAFKSFCHVINRESCGTPHAGDDAGVQMEPGPMPTFTPSAPFSTRNVLPRLWLCCLPLRQSRILAFTALSTPIYTARMAVAVSITMASNRLPRVRLRGPSSRLSTDTGCHAQDVPASLSQRKACLSLW